MLVRDAVAADIPVLADIFFRAVRDGATAYSEAERAAWAPERPSAADWSDRLGGLETIVAETDGSPIGFMSLRPEDNYLDLAFVLPEWRGRGVAERIYTVLETRARASGLHALHTHASRMARPFFARLGWVETSSEHVTRGQQVLERFVMHKTLNSGVAAA